MAPPASIPNYGHALDRLFGRQKEVAELRSRLAQRKSFVLHGPPGSGKTFLLWHVIPKFSRVLYCSDSSNPRAVFREIAVQLLRDNNRRAARALSRSSNDVRQKSTIALRGIAMDALHEAHYSVILDHLRCPSAALASDIRALMHRGNTCVIAVARSSHMEELGYIAPYFVLQSEQMELKNLNRKDALAFAKSFADEMALVASNRQDFLSSAAELGDGAPGAIVSMIKMAVLPRYRCADHIKVSPLYIDFRLAWHSANAY